MNILVFPLGVDGGLDFVRNAKQLGFKVIGASSVDSNQVFDFVDLYEYLPYITDSGFQEFFYSILKKHNITHVFTAHDGVWAYFDSLSIRSMLCKPSPFRINLDKAAVNNKWAKQAADRFFIEDVICDSYLIKNKINNHQYAWLHNVFLNIPGQTDEDKLFFLSEIMRVALAGDIVEIGVLYGRSALSMAALSGFYNIGSVICIDPWCNKFATDQGEAAKIITVNKHIFDLEGIYNKFITEAVGYSNVGYIRKNSEQAIEQYSKASHDGVLSSRYLSDISIEGAISILHIDGNHSYKNVKKDIELWFPYVMSGGWVLLDDYLWAFGDGPKVAGDELIEHNEIDLAFVSGDTLYLRKI